MSTQTSAAARRSVLSSLLVRLLQVLGLTIRRSGPSQPLSSKTRSRRAFAFETLEPRLMMSADLTGDLAGVALPAHVLPSDHLSIPVVIHNNGADASSLTPVVRLYASASGHVDADSIVLGESAIKNTGIKAGKTATVNVAIDASLIDAPGSYSLIAVVDATNKVRESNEGNNTVVAANPLQIDWSFGSVAGHTNTDSITLTDPTGTQVTFKLSGAGRGDVTLDGNAFDVHLTGTNANSKLSITAAGGACVATIDDLLVDGSLNAIQVSNANLTGLLSLGGTVRSIELGDIGQDAGISVAGSATSIKLVADRVTGADIVSASAFDSISIGDWRAAGSDAGSIRATSIGDLEVDGVFAANLTLSGAASGTTLGSAEIAGRVSSALWNIHGSAGSIEAGSTDANWHGAFSGSVQKFETDGDMRGALSAHDIGTLHVGGDMIGARVLAGADLGSDGLAGGTGSAADRFNQTVMTQLRVDHSIRDSTIMVGVNPVDGVYGNGNDVFVGGQASRLQSLIVEGKLLGATDVFAGAFAQKVKINGANVNSSGVAQLHTSLPDTVAPTLAMALAQDTGVLASDRITSNPTIAGTANDAGGIATLTGSLDGSAFKNVKAYLHADGSYSLDAAALAFLKGSSVADGAHTLVLRAADAANNLSTSSLSFTLDRSAPAISGFELDAASDSGIAGDRLTNKTSVKLEGFTQAGSAVELVGLGLTAMADNLGYFSFANVALGAEGVNAFTVRATDVAGNASTLTRTITRDTTGPTISAGLQNDSGASSSDGVTNDPSLTGHASDGSNVVSLTVSFDGNSAETLAVPAPDFGFTLSAGYLDSLAGGALADGPHAMFLQARDAAGNVSTREVDFILDRELPLPPVFNLAVASDTGVQGDQHTETSIVSLTGFVETGATLTLEGHDITPVIDGNTFRFDGVTLHSGENVLTTTSVDLAGNERMFTGSVFLDGAGTAEGAYPDLVVTSIDAHLTGGFDEFGQALLQVDWVIANTGSATAHGRVGAWSDSVYLSMFDAVAFSGDDAFLGSLLTTEDLEAGAQRLNTITVSVPNWVPQSGYHIYVVTDDEVNFTANEVAEKTAGEYNNTTIDYVPSGMPPPDIAPHGPELPLDVTQIGGAINAPGETNVYTFDLTHQSKIYFDSLSPHSDVKWELQTADGQVVFGRSFADSDAFGMGPINALLNLQAGSYKLVVSGELPGSTDSYAFRLMDMDAVASHSLVLDGGPILGEHLARGDQSNVYQFEATGGTQYVVGGPGDNTVEGALFWRLFDPQGQQIWTGDNSPSDLTTFSETGTYTLIVEGNVERTDPTTYNAYVFTPQDRHYELPIGGAVHGFLDSPDQVNTYTFTLTEASTLFFDGHLNSNGNYFHWSLDGQGVHVGDSTRYDSPVFMDLGPGVYTLTLNADDHASGWYDFTLMDVLHDAAPTLMLDTPTGGFMYPGFTSTLYHFDAHAGEHLSIAYNNANGPDFASYDPATWLLVDTAGHVASTGTVGDPTSVDFDADGHWTLLIKGRQGNWAAYDYSLELSDGQTPPPIGVTFDLAPESDTGILGDFHTTQSLVTLAGIAAPNSMLTLAGTPLTTFADAAGAFHFFDVTLTLGGNTFTVFAQDTGGLISSATHTIFLDQSGGGPEPGQFPDLVATSIDAHLTGGHDELGQALLQVDWITANTGSAVAHGRTGMWGESVYLSMNDAVPFSGDDLFLGYIVNNVDLDAGAQRLNTLTTAVPDWVPSGYHLYVVVDDDLGFIANEVAEKTAGEYNNTTIDYVPSGSPPPDIAPSGSVLALDGTQVGGAIDAPGETDTYTFNLTHETRLYFDSLSPHSDVKWELQTADGQALFGRTFDKSDAFGMGPINALLDLQAGSYKLVVSSIFEQGTDDYAFRLMDVDAVASHDLILDGGPLLGQHLARGDQTDIYQFNATEGTHYVVGGPGDNTVEDALFWRLFDPQGNQIWTGDHSPSDEHTFQQTGTYTLMVEGNVERTESVAYNAYVFTPQDRQIALPADGQVHGFLDSPDQVNTYTFTLTEHSSLFFDGHLNSNGPYFDWTLQGQSGTPFTGNTRQDSGGLMELDAGSYTLTIRGQDHASGWYDFRLMDLLHDSAEVLTADVAVHNISYPGFNANLFHFDALADQHFVISLTTTDTQDMSFDPAQWLLVDPQGHVAMGGAAGIPTEFNPGLSGTWTVLMTGRQFSWTPVDYMLAINSQVAA